MKFNQHLRLSKFSKKIKERIEIIKKLLLSNVDSEILRELKEEFEILQLKEIKLFNLTLNLWRNRYANN